PAPRLEELSIGRLGVERGTTSPGVTSPPGALHDYELLLGHVHLLLVVGYPVLVVLLTRALMHGDVARTAARTVPAGPAHVHLVRLTTAVAATVRAEVEVTREGSRLLFPDVRGRGMQVVGRRPVGVAGVIPLAV